MCRCHRHVPLSPCGNCSLVSSDGRSRGVVLEAALGPVDLEQLIPMFHQHHRSGLFDKDFVDLPGASQPKVAMVAGTTYIEFVQDVLQSRGCDRIDAMKIDVEGFEFAVLRGFEKLLAKNQVRFLLLEFGPIMLASSGTKALHLLQFLSHYGFQCRCDVLDGGAVTFEDFLHLFEGADRLAKMDMPYDWGGDLPDWGSQVDLFCENLYWQSC